jgi:hypothetical protein
MADIRIYSAHKPTNRTSVPAKVDIADGLYRIWVKAADVPKLGVLLPAGPGQERLTGFPVVLSMGWKESSTVFTSATETVADLANDQITQGNKQPPHHLDIQAESCSNKKTSQCIEKRAV